MYITNVYNSYSLNSILFVVFETQRFSYVQILRVLLFLEITGVSNTYTYTQVVSVFMQVSYLNFYLIIVFFLINVLPQML